MGATRQEILDLADFWESRGDATEAARLRASVASIIEQPEVKRLIQLQEAVRAVTDEDVEIVDAVGVYVNFDHRTAITIMPEDETDAPPAVILSVTEWDQSGGVSSEVWLGTVRDELAPAVVRAFLDANAQREAELTRHLEEDAEPRELVDLSKLTHIQRVDNAGNPIGPRIKL